MSNNKDAAKYATVGFATVMGSPSTRFTPTQVQSAAKNFHDRALSRLDRHSKICDVVREHAKSK